MEKKIEKTRNNKRWTEARFRGFVTSALRGSFRRWPPKWDVLANACTGVKKNKSTGRQAKHYTCAICKKEFVAKGVQIDHINPIGATDSWDAFIEALFCEAENLQVACKSCHQQKSRKETKNRTKIKKNKFKSKNDTKKRLKNED